MITADYAALMAAYNRWQNSSIYAAASSLDDRERCQDRGAFFGSIHGTLSHVLWADQMWMHRFAGTAPAQSLSLSTSHNMVADWDSLCEQRITADAVILDWASNLPKAWLEGDLTWRSGSTGRDITRPKAVLLTHFFNHQTHHRGQVHCMLTQCGAKPDDTDIPLMPDGG